MLTVPAASQTRKSFRMIKNIKTLAVLGSGIMGSSLACHFANLGFDVLLLDLPSGTGSRNQSVDENLKKVIRSNPSPLFTKALASRIQTGNLEDDLEKIRTCDWIVEAIVEDPGIKQDLFRRIEPFRKPGALFTTNTSGIPINLLARDMPMDFQRHFFGTHFFNPPRYLRLLEVIPGTMTDPKLISDFMEFGRTQLGKQMVLCKDTPAFIANRIGIFSISRLMELTSSHSYNIETVDALTGPVLGRPKTGTYRLQDLIGIDVGVSVMKHVLVNCPDDEYLKLRRDLANPPAIRFLLDKAYLGNKSGQGFYKKTKEKDEFGKSLILALDLQSLEYRPTVKPRLDSIGSARHIEGLAGKIRHFFQSEEEGAAFVREYLLSLFAYVSHRIPEISDQLFPIDDAMKSGYGWEVGPFEYWDMVGLEKATEIAENQGFHIAEWVKKMIHNGIDSFYRLNNGHREVYDPRQHRFIPVPGAERQILLSGIADKVLYKNSEARLYDMGEGIICLEFASKNNVIGEGTGEAMLKAVDLAEEEGWNGIVIGNNAPNFTVGANLMMVAMYAYQKDWKKLEELVDGFQQANMRLRYSRVPVVTATQGYVFGGGTEMAMHTDAVVAAAESYIGLVEAGVGLIPGGGGTKEFALRLSDSLYEGDVMIPKLAELFKTIAMAQVATSAAMAFDFKFLLPERDEVCLNSDEVLFQAREKAGRLARGYLAPSRKKIRVLGQTGLAALLAAINEFQLGRFISEHDALIARKTAWVMCGGDLSGNPEVSEQYLLDLEREAFISLCGESKTLDRIQYMLQYNKPLRN